MKVNIGPYTSDLVTFRNLERKYEDYRSKQLGIPFFEYEPVTKIDKAVENTVNFLQSLFSPVNRYWNSRKRKIKVHIHDYDVWSADHTLALIIVPVLQKLKEVKHGYPHVDNEDVPEELRFSKEDKEKLEYDGTVDAKHEARWEWVLDEMIWAFEPHRNDEWENQYHHNDEQLEITFKSIPNSKNSELVVNRQKDLSKPAYHVDTDGIAKHNARMDNGRRLFAKYYNGLWD